MADKLLLNDGNFLQLEDGTGDLLLETLTGVGWTVDIENPDTPAGPVFPTLIIEAAFQTDPFSDTPAWTDITSDVMSFGTNRGRSFELDAVQAGTLTLTLRNLDRIYDPTYTDGPYYGQLTPNRRIRVRAQWLLGIYPIFDGFVDAWTQVGDDPANRANTTVVTATDAFKHLAKNNLTPVGAWIIGDPDYGLVGSFIIGGQLIFRVDELPGDRVNRILDLWPFPASMRDVDDGLTLLGADGTNKTGKLDANETALGYLTKITDTEYGRLFVAADGRITWWARDHWEHTMSQSVAQITLTDQPVTDIDQANYKAITVDPADDRYIRNVIERTRTNWKASVVAQDQNSSRTYGAITDSRAVVARYQADAIAQAKFLLAKYKDSHIRISQVILHPQHSPALMFPKLLGLEIGDRVIVERTIGNIGFKFAQEMWVEGINHNVTAHRTWEVTLQTAPVDQDIY